MYELSILFTVLVIIVTITMLYWGFIYLIEILFGNDKK